MYLGATAIEVRLAQAWGYLDAAALIEPRALLDREKAMLWKLTH